MSEAVMVALPAVLSVTLKLVVPATSAALEGNTAFGSLEVIATVSFVLTAFQFASTALTVTVKAVPAVCAFGVPVLPATVPGAADSPGTNNWSLANAPTLTVMDGLVLLVFVPSVMSVAVRVAVPAVLKVTLKDFVPETSAALPGKAALASDEVIPTVSVMLVARFQKMSTELTVALKAVPAI